MIFLFKQVIEISSFKSNRISNYSRMTSNEEADWNKAHEVDSQTGRPTKELYTDNDPVTTIKGKYSEQSSKAQ